MYSDEPGLATVHSVKQGTITKIGSGLRDAISRQYVLFRASKQLIGFEDRAAAGFNRMRYAVKKQKVNIY